MAMVVRGDHRIGAYMPRTAGRAVATGTGVGSMLVGLKRGYDWYNRTNKLVGSRSKRIKTKSNAKLSRKQKTITKQVKYLKKISEADMGTHTHRSASTSQLLCNVNVQNFISSGRMSTTELEGVIANLKYYDPSNPATLLTADGTTGSYQKELYFKTVGVKIRVVNNYQSRCKCTLYLCQPKADTNVTPSLAWTGGMTDQSNGLATAVNSYPSDVELFTDLWSAKKVREKYLCPGQSLGHSTYGGNFSYDPSFVDTHPLAFQKKYKASYYLIVIQGDVSHDTSLLEIGLSACGVDIHVDKTYIVKYPAGIDLDYNFNENNFSSFTNGAVQSSKPVADNIGYSIS